MPVLMMWTRLMIVWEEFCGGWSILCNVDTGGQLDNEANIQALNLYDHHDQYIREVSQKNGLITKREVGKKLSVVRLRVH